MRVGGNGPYLFVSGRWDNVVSVVDVDAALKAGPGGSAAAIVSRPRVTPDIDGGTGRAGTPASGQPVNLVIAADRRLAYVVNHSGRATPEAAAAFQHGHPGLIAVLDVAKALDPANSGTTNALVDCIETGTAGPVGLALTPDGKHLVVSSAEAAGLEDGGRQITLIDLAARRVVRQVVQALAGNGLESPPQPSAHPAPHASFGSFPNANGVAVSPLEGGVILAGNGGTDDVSVINLARALNGDSGAEVARVPVQAGPFGLAVSPDGRLCAVANRESARTGVEGNTVSLIDVARAAAGDDRAERARIRVGTDRAEEATRPFAVAFTRGGDKVVATCFRSNTVSVVDVGQALAGAPAEERRELFTASDGGPGRPRGLVMLPDGEHVAIIGGAKGAPGSSLVWIVDLKTLSPRACVTGVGNESYLLDVLPTAP
jgi:DNA-binding beta-propeller fold protein YncE